MHRITAAQFKQAVEHDPAWASKLTEPVEITGYCGMTGSSITHLSPLLYFSGKSEKSGVSACFAGCEQLKKATGRFAGEVDFERSGVEEIDQLIVETPGATGNAANFNYCRDLKVARGRYPGAVGFVMAKITKIEDLVVTQPNDLGIAAEFLCCPIESAEGEFAGMVDFRGSGIKRIGNLIVTQPDNSGMAADFSTCAQLETAQGNFPGTVCFTKSGVARIQELNLPDGSTADFSDCVHLKAADNPKYWLRRPNTLLPAGTREDFKRALARDVLGRPQTALEL